MTTVMRRIVVVGNSGSGKTTLADELARRLQLCRVELDALYHGPDWTPEPIEQFRSGLLGALAQAERESAGWVVCGNYSSVRDDLWQRADTILWLDFPRAVVMTRILRRTATRVLLRSELWNGNQERLCSVLSLHDPERSILRWAWDGVAGYRTKYAPIWGHADIGPKRWVRFTSPAHLRAWLEVVAPRP